MHFGHLALLVELAGSSKCGGPSAGADTEGAAGNGAARAGGKYPSRAAKKAGGGWQGIWLGGSLRAGGVGTLA